MLEKSHVLLQRLLPKELLSQCIYHLTRYRHKTLVGIAIRLFIRYFEVNMDEAEHKDPRHYPDFNSFFTRTLRPGARQIAAATLISPTDSSISQFGAINDGTLIQAKKRHYRLQTLLARDLILTDILRNGQFLVLYLSPRSYHRIHMPITGTVRQMVYVPGRLYSVDPRTTRNLDCLFARNERLVIRFDTHMGTVVIIMVGAVLVRSMTTVWHGEVNQTHRDIQVWQYPDTEEQKIVLRQGDEMGHFSMGSTVMLLHADSDVRWDPNLCNGQMLYMGQKLA